MEKRTSRTRSPRRKPNTGRLWVLSAALVVATLLVYGQAAGFEFVRTDDSVYVTENPQGGHGCLCFSTAFDVSCVQWCYGTRVGCFLIPLARH